MEAKIKHFDLVIIGSGPGGYLSAILSAQKGMSVAVIERAELGGTCLNRGCIPTKALLKDAFLWDVFTRSGWIRGKSEASAAFKQSLERKETAVNQVVAGLRSLLNRDRITLILGEASFINPRTLIIKRDGNVVEQAESDRVLIASGAVPKEISGLKRDDHRVIGSDDVLKMSALLSEVAIVGAGRRGVEFASLFNSYGTKVTLIEKAKRILPKMDREISSRYRTILAKKGVKLLAETEAVASDASARDGAVSLTVFRKGKEEKLDFQKILVVGERRANADGLSLEKASLTLKDGFLPVDLHMRTTNPGIYAAGDVVGRWFMAHNAFAEARTAVENLSGKKKEIDYRLIPFCLYANPEAASVGYTQEEAEERYQQVKVGQFPFMGCGRAVAAGEQEGTVKIISDPKYGEVLGIHILGAGATEMIHLGAMAMQQEMVVEEIKRMIFAHPTFSEAFFEAALDSDSEAIHMIRG